MQLHSGKPLEPLERRAEQLLMSPAELSQYVCRPDLTCACILGVRQSVHDQWVMLQPPLVGNEAPDFLAQAVFDQEFVEVSLSQYRVRLKQIDTLLVGTAQASADSIKICRASTWSCSSTLWISLLSAQQKSQLSQINMGTLRS